MKLLRKKRILCFALCACSLFSGAFTACNEKTPSAKTYAQDEFILAGFWAPYEITEEGFEKYKACGLNTVMFTNHSRDTSQADSWTPDDPVMSQTRYYLGSQLTVQTLEMCRKTGLKAILEENGAWFDLEETPFSNHDLYGDYRDLIVGMHVVDEPNATRLAEYCSPSRIADFQKNYSVPFMINLLPNTAPNTATGTVNYDAYLAEYEKYVLQTFPENPFVSVDFYPFHRETAADFTNTDKQWIYCYEKVSALANKYDATLHFYIQSAEGKEFVSALSEADMRYQIYTGLCFGGSRFTYYCYSVPDTEYSVTDGTSVPNPMYSACLLDENNQPTHLYGYVKEINAEIQAFASVFKAYDFTKCMPICVQEYDNENFKTELYAMNTVPDFSDRRYVADVTTEGNCLVGCFDRTEDEAYMLTNYGYPSETQTLEVTLTLKNGATHLAVYGGDGFNGTPTIVKAKKGKCVLSIKAGEGKFVVPLA